MGIVQSRCHGHIVVVVHTIATVDGCRESSGDGDWPHMLPHTSVDLAVVGVVTPIRTRPGWCDSVGARVVGLVLGQRVHDQDSASVVDRLGWLRDAVAVAIDLGDGSVILSTGQCWE